MYSENTIQTRASVRDAALRKLNRLTAGVAFSALAGVGGLAVVSGETIPGTSAPNSGAPTSTAPATSAEPSTFEPSSGVSAGSGPAHVVTGAS